MAGIYTEISISSVARLGKLLSSGKITETALRNYYRQALPKARSRVRKLKSEQVRAEFGPQETPTFEPLRNLKSTEALLREVFDISAFLRKRESTIGGLKAKREYHLETLQAVYDIEVDTAQYPLWNEFSKWFQLSEYSKKFEYIIIKEVWEDITEHNERPTKEDFERAFAAYEKYQNSRSKRRHY